MPYLVGGGLSILEYAHDTALFMEHDLENGRNLKLLLSAFEKMSGLKINFQKVYYSSLENTMRRLRHTPSCLVVRKTDIQLNIWEY